jgi:threonine/homoserine/homoserine lactone efflux protein
MSQQLTIAFVLFAIVASFTPGPNNAMLLASGLNFGFRRTLPHVMGVALGFGFLVAVMGFGLGAVFTAYPALYTVLKYAGAAYLVYLAWAIATSGGIDEKGAARGRPLTFLGAALFQWVNVKGLIVTLSSLTIYSAIAPYPWNVVTLSLVFGLVGFLSAAAWALFGASLRGLLSTPRAVRAFNIVMALLLVASLYPVLTDSH